jgi:hypothetical protein
MIRLPNTSKIIEKILKYKNQIRNHIRNEATLTKSDRVHRTICGIIILGALRSIGVAD